MIASSPSLGSNTGEGTSARAGVGGWGRVASFHPV